MADMSPGPGTLPTCEKLLFPFQSKAPKNVEWQNRFGLQKGYLERRELPQGSTSLQPQSTVTTVLRKINEIVPNTGMQRDTHRNRKESVFGRSSYDNGNHLLQLSREASSDSEDIEGPTPTKDLENGSDPSLPRPPNDPEITKIVDEVDPLNMNINLTLVRNRKY